MKPVFEGMDSCIYPVRSLHIILTVIDIKA